MLQEKLNYNLSIYIILEVCGKFCDNQAQMRRWKAINPPPVFSKSKIAKYKG